MITIIAVTTTDMTMLDDFLTRAVLAGLGMAVAAGPLGSFIVWRRMAYFGDAIAHAAILGVALAVIFSFPVTIGTLAVALAMGGIVSWLTLRGHSMDATLGVLSHSALAVGLVAVSFAPSVRVDLSAYLFGDILAVGKDDLVTIWGGAIVVVALLVWRWSRLLTATMSEELAQASGINARVESLVLTLALALVVAVSLKVVGAILVSSMLIIPASAARAVSRTPEAMAMIASLIAGVSALGGLGASYQFDTPAGPSIVVAAAVIFAVVSLVPRR